jgi:hypothetical protein
MKKQRFFETSVTIYQSTRRNIPENFTLCDKSVCLFNNYNFYFSVMQATKAELSLWDLCFTFLGAGIGSITSVGSSDWKPK